MGEQNISRRRVVYAAEEARAALEASRDNLEAARIALRVVEKMVGELKSEMARQVERMDGIERVNLSLRGQLQEERTHLESLVWMVNEDQARFRAFRDQSFREKLAWLYGRR